MELRILGTRGKIPQSAPDHKNHTGILVDGKLLIDLGEPTYMENRPAAVVFTHFHPDHAYFVANKERFAPGIPLFGPEPHELIPEMEIITGPFRFADYQITPVPVIHALRLKSLGYLIEKQDKKLFISGDVAWIEKAELNKLPKVDLVITEASFLRKGGMIRRRQDNIFGHTGIPDLIRLLGPLSPRMLFLHYGSWFFRDPEASKEKLRSLGSAALEIIPSRDGMELTL